MRRVARSWVMLLVAAFWLSASGQATAGEPTDLIRQTTDQVLKILEDPNLQGPAKQAERQDRLRKVSDQAFDWQEMARRALAVHWRERTPQQRQEFVELFRDLVERTYMNRLETATQEKQDIQYVGEQVDGSRALVKTNVLTKRNQQVPIEYRLHKSNGRWLVYDVLIEGISLINNYRSQFNRIISSSSYNELVQKMKARHEDELSGGPPRKVQ
ncbi:MAG TPA: ABC transporter substrate-binding protein [Candidatus Tectomicrobia bacterium]|nr:ABC transporter substrate-binding protein [Candidatus Tectomicrobia bacterium]